MDPRLLSLDIETYGACERATDGTALPTQTVFHPARSIHTDRVPLQHLVLSCALTLVDGDPMDPTTWEPGDTMVLDMSREMHRECLCRWLDHATHLLGANIQFDILYLRKLDPSFRMRLGGRHHLTDLTVLNYLHSEFREGGLKQLGETLGTHTYAESLKDGHRFKSPHDPKFLGYAAADTHNTVMAARELANRIAQDYPETDKGSTYSLDWYSKTVWAVIRMSEAGIPMSMKRLYGLGEELDRSSSEAVLLAQERHGLTLEGPGSASSRSGFMERCLQEAPDIVDHPMLELTPKTKQVSWSSGNRKLLASVIQDPELSDALALVERHVGSQKLLSTYLWPLLFHRKTNPLDQRSVLIPWDQLNAPRPRPQAASPPTTSRSAGKTGTASPSTSASSTTSSLSRCRNYLLPMSDEPTEAPGSSPTSPTPGCSPSTGTGSSTSSFWRPPSTCTRTRREGDSISYPTWYVVPGRFKNSGSEGGTVQARITCKHPSAQTFPPVVKKAMGSRWLDGSLLWMDLSQVELRVAAMLSGEEALLASFREGKDLHTDRTIQLFGGEVLQDPDFKDTWRQVGKTINFADLFLASPTRMQHSAYEMTGRLLDLGIFERAAKRRPQDRPRLWAWQQGLLKSVERRGYLDVPLTGQSRTFVDGPKRNRNTVVNFPIQTVAANTTLAIQHELSAILHPVDPGREIDPRPRILMCLQIYDSVCLDVPKGMEPQAHQAIRDSVERVCSEGGYWSRMEEWSGNKVPLDYETS